jgi:hypothetical protein
MKGGLPQTCTVLHPSELEFSRIEDHASKLTWCPLSEVRKTPLQRRLPEAARKSGSLFRLPSEPWDYNRLPDKSQDHLIEWMGANMR